MVTVNLDQVFFKQKVRVGKLVNFYAHVNYVGNSSMEIGIRVVAEDLRTHEKRYTTSCYFTRVAVNDKGQSIKVPTLEFNSEIEQPLFRAGAMRRTMRKEMMKKNAQLHVEIEQDDL